MLKKTNSVAYTEQGFGDSSIIPPPLLMKTTSMAYPGKTLVTTPSNVEDVKPITINVNIQNPAPQEERED